MAFTVWSALTWVFLPLGGLIALLVLSGFETLENLGRRFTRIDIQVGEGRIPIAHIIVGFCFCIFGGEVYSLRRLQTQRSQMSLEPLEFNDKWRAVLWRHQRNWWLALSNIILWVIICRIDVLVQAFRAEIQAIEKRKIELLQEGAETQVKKAAEAAEASSKAAKATPKSEREKKRD